MHSLRDRAEDLTGDCPKTRETEKGLGRFPSRTRRTTTRTIHCKFSIGTSFFPEHSILRVGTLSSFPVNFVKHRGPLSTLGRKGLSEMTADEPKTSEDDNQCFGIQTQLQTLMNSASEKSKLINEHSYNRSHPVCQFGEASPRHTSELFNYKIRAGLGLPTKTTGGEKSEGRMNLARFTRSLDAPLSLSIPFKIRDALRKSQREPRPYPLFRMGSAMQAALQGTLQLHLCGTLAVSRRMILIAQEGEKGKETKIPQKTMGLHPKPEEC